MLPQGKADPRVRSYVLPTRIVWSSGNINAPEHLLTWVAASRLGAIWVPLNAGLVGEDLAYTLTNAAPRVLVVGSELVERIDALDGAIPEMHVLVAGAAGGRRPFSELLEPGGACPEVHVAAGDPAVVPLPRYPSVVRDIAILVDDTTAAATVRAVIEDAAPSTLVRVREFDRYQGKGIPDGKISLALHLTFRSSDRTLTDAEVQSAMDAVLSALASRLGATQR